MIRKTAQKNAVGAGVEIGLGIRAGHAAGHGIRKAASDEVCRQLSGRHFLITLLCAAIWQYFTAATVYQQEFMAFYVSADMSTLYG